MRLHPMNLVVVSCLLVGCPSNKLELASGFDTSSPIEGEEDDAEGDADDDAAWWEEDVDDPGDTAEDDTDNNTDNDTQDEDAEEEEDDDKPDDEDDDKPDDEDDDKPEDDSGYAACGDDFDPNAPCEGGWETTICMHEGLLWWCDDGEWMNEDDKP